MNVIRLVRQGAAHAAGQTVGEHARGAVGGRRTCPRPVPDGCLHATRVTVGSLLLRSVIDAGGEHQGDHDGRRWNGHHDSDDEHGNVIQAGHR